VLLLLLLLSVCWCHRAGCAFIQAVHLRHNPRPDRPEPAFAQGI
jgi:hypothetical protein